MKSMNQHLKSINMHVNGPKTNNCVVNVDHKFKRYLIARIHLTFFSLDFNEFLQATVCWVVHRLSMHMCVYVCCMQFNTRVLYLPVFSGFIRLAAIRTNTSKIMDIMLRFNWPWRTTLLINFSTFSFWLDFLFSYVSFMCVCINKDFVSLFYITLNDISVCVCVFTVFPKLHTNDFRVHQIH